MGYLLEASGDGLSEKNIGDCDYSGVEMEGRLVGDNHYTDWFGESANRQGHRQISFFSCSIPLSALEIDREMVPYPFSLYK
ncbi:Hypothetical predicted protein [Olea europaea subsp. europaea]|uniref:Uncharacterized protein n=1 Tax=Olea europaea subsp. europaea TaxID=158383 RepID=A0A8S0PKT4_OLEEU|nr:Hypothetical predicted protein [Olea europaea subsp. europaea]